jgi:Ca2+-binding EF-hand superfamily protein
MGKMRTLDGRENPRSIQRCEMRFLVLSCFTMAVACLTLLEGQALEGRAAETQPQSGSAAAQKRKSAAPRDTPQAGQPGAARLKAELIKRFDANGNGRLDPEEMQAARAAAAKAGQGQNFDAITRQELLKHFDRNGDGQLDAAEQKAAREATANRTQGSRAGSTRQQAVLKEFDANGNGKLDPAEKQAAKQAAKRKQRGN